MLLLLVKFGLRSHIGTPVENKKSQWWSSSWCAKRREICCDWLDILFSLVGSGLRWSVHTVNNGARGGRTQGSLFIILHFTLSRRLLPLVSQQNGRARDLQTVFKMWPFPVLSGSLTSFCPERHFKSPVCKMWLGYDYYIGERWHCQIRKTLSCRLPEKCSKLDL